MWKKMKEWRAKVAEGKKSKMKEREWKNGWERTNGEMKKM